MPVPGNVTDMSTIASSNRANMAEIHERLANLERKFKAKSSADHESVSSASTRASKRFSEEQKSLMQYTSTSLFRHVKVVSHWGELEYGGNICKFMMKSMKIEVKYGSDEDRKKLWWDNVKKAIPEGLSRRRSNVQGMLRKAVRGMLALCVALCDFSFILCANEFPQSLVP